MKKLSIALLATVLSGAAFGGLRISGAAFESGSEASSPQQPVHPTRAQLRARHESIARIATLTDQSDFAGARALLDLMVSNPTFDWDPIEARRLSGFVARREGNTALAEQELRQALHMLNGNPDAARQSPPLRSVILMDLAQLVAIDRGNAAEGIALYDRVHREESAAFPRDKWLAAKNAAILSARLGRYAEGIQRIDSVLAAMPDNQVPVSEIISLRATQATWCAASGDLPGALQRALALWNEHQNRDDLSVLETGIRVAEWRPAIGELCQFRISTATEILDRINGLRAAPSQNPHAPTLAQLAELERQALVVIVNSRGCPQREAIAMARARLGLRPEP